VPHSTIACTFGTFPTFCRLELTWIKLFASPAPRGFESSSGRRVHLSADPRTADHSESAGRISHAKDYASGESEPLSREERPRVGSRLSFAPSSSSSVRSFLRCLIYSILTVGISQRRHFRLRGDTRASCMQQRQSMKRICLWAKCERSISTFPLPLPLSACRFAPSLFSRLSLPRIRRICRIYCRLCLFVSLPLHLS